MGKNELYDFSDYPKNSPFCDDVNKKVMGKFKDETAGNPINILAVCGLKCTPIYWKMTRSKTKPNEYEKM